jgi:hypothetical protein
VTDGNDSAIGSLLARSEVKLVLLLLAGVAVNGIVRRQLATWGFDTIGPVVYVIGYGGMIVLAWYIWLRPLDLSGPSGEVTYGDDDDPAEE